MAKMNFDFSELKDKLSGTFSTVADKVLDFADVAADTAKTGQQLAKLYMEKKKEESALEDAYEELGKLYYNLYKQEATGVLADLCMEIENTLVNIEDIETEIQSVKDSTEGSSAGIHFDYSTYDSSGDFVQPCNEDDGAFEKMMDKVEDKVETITDKIEDAVESIEDEIEVRVEEYLDDDDFVSPKEDEDIEVEIVEEKP